MRNRATAAKRSKCDTVSCARKKLLTLLATPIIRDICARKNWCRSAKRLKHLLKKRQQERPMISTGRKLCTTTSSAVCATINQALAGVAATRYTRAMRAPETAVISMRISLLWREALTYRRVSLSPRAFQATRMKAKSRAYIAGPNFWRTVDGGRWISVKRGRTRNSLIIILVIIRLIALN